jgi:hypothetical protein
MDRGDGQIVARRKSPKGTGYDKHLYRLRGYADASSQQVEERFFQPIDSRASDALGILESGHPLIDMRVRSAWTQFIMSLLLRCPEDLKAFRQIWSRIIASPAPGVEERYQESRDPGQPETFADFVNGRPLPVRERELFETYTRLIAHERIGPYIASMNWHVIGLPDTDYELLTSDRPVAIPHPLLEEIAYIGIPIGPRKLFLATKRNWRPNLDTLRQRNLIVRQFNRFSVAAAVRFVYGRTDTQLSFVRAHFGESPQHRFVDDMEEGALRERNRAIAEQRTASSPPTG